MDVTRGQVEVAIKGLLSQDRYKPLSPHVGGWFWASKAVWTVLSTFQSLGPAALEAMARTALAAPQGLADLLAAFVSDLFAILGIIAAEAGDISADADAFGQTPAGQLLLGVLAPEWLAASGGEGRLARAVAGVLNPAPLAAGFAAATGRNAGEAAGRIASRLGGGRRSARR